MSYRREVVKVQDAFHQTESWRPTFEDPDIARESNQLHPFGMPRSRKAERKFPTAKHLNLDLWQSIPFVVQPTHRSIIIPTKPHKESPLPPSLSRLPCRLQLPLKIPIKISNHPIVIPSIHQIIRIFPPLLCLHLLSFRELVGREVAFAFELVHYPFVEGILPVD